MAAGIIVLPQYMPARDRNGRLVSGALMGVYLNRTTTKTSVYSDSSLSTPLANPVVADSSGRFPIMWTEAGTIEEPVLITLAVSGPGGLSIGNPAVFHDWQASLDADVATIALAMGAQADADAAEAAATAAEAALAEIEAIAASAPEFPAILNKLDRDGGNIQDDFAIAARGINIIVRNTPFGFGATGNDSVADTAAVNAMIADGVRTIYVPGSIQLTSLAMVDDLVIEMANGAEIIRPAAATGTQWITATGKSGFRILGGVLNGQGELTANPHNILSLLSGCSNFEVDGVRFLNPKRSGASWGGGLSIADTVDLANGTASRVANLKMSCPSDATGAYAAIVYRAGALQIRDLVAQNFFNGALSINDPTIPVPQNVLKQKLIDVIGVYDTDCGGGVFVFGSREDVDAFGNVLGHNIISGLMNISHCVSIRPSTYGFFVQGMGVDASNIKVVDGTCDPEDLFGGILFDSTGGTLSNFTVENSPGVALELGGSVNTKAIGGSIRGNSVIGINTGSSQYTRASHISIDGPQTGVLASGFDGADGTNFFKDRGRGLVLKDIDYYAYASTDRAIVGANGFQRIAIGSFRSHIRDSGAKGLTFDLSGADDIVWTDDGSFEVDETDANLTNHGSRVEVASAATITVPDHARIVSVTGTTQVNTIKLRSQETIGTGIRAIIANAGSFGSGYVPGTDLTIAGDGTGALAIAVISDGGVYGGYMIAKGSGYTTAPVTADTGTGAVLTAAIGPASMVDHQLLLKFTGACPVGNAVGNIFLGASYTAPVNGAGSVPLLGNFSNFSRISQ